MTKYLWLSIFFLSTAVQFASSTEVVMTDINGQSAWLYTPADKPDPEKTYWLVVGVHGVGGNGKGACDAAYLADDFSDVIVLGPTFTHANSQQPADVTATRPRSTFNESYQMSGPSHEAKLAALVAEIGKRWKLHPKIILHGFSAGAQFAHRYAMKNPHLVAGVSAHSAGAWAKLEGDDKINTNARLISFALSCGEDDRGSGGPPGSLPRIEGCRDFAKNLQSLGFTVDLKTWPGIGHWLAPSVKTVVKKLVERVRSSDVLPLSAFESLPLRPRLIAKSDRWESLKSQIKSDPVSQKMFSLIRKRTENLLALPSLDLSTKGIYLHGPMRQIQGRIACLAMMYRLSGDDRYLARAKQEMHELATVPHWRPGHFLSTAEATLAMSLGLDWLYEYLSDVERDKFAQAIIEKGLKPSLEAEINQETWLVSAGNWGPVCHGAMAIGAIAIAERDPQLAQRIVNRSIASVRFAAASYAPVGAHSEGPGYWAYGTNFYFLMADALRTTFGSMFDLEKPDGIMRTGDYNLQMTTPSGGMFSFGDSVPEFGFEPVMFWFAREHREYYFAAPTIERLDSLREILVSDNAQPDASRLQSIALLWWDPALTPAADEVDSHITEGPLTWWSEGGPQPQAVMRSSWSDTNAAYVGIKGGKSDESHSHMDAGSFIYEVDGVRWAVDLGRNDYNSPRRHGLGDDLFNATQESKRWSIFRNGADSHNILRFNSTVQCVDGMTEIRPAVHADVSPGFVVDLSPAYAGQVTSAQRGIRLRSDGSLLIRDEWHCGDRASAVAWQWMTFANVEVSNHSATLVQNGKSIQLQVVAPADAHISAEDVSSARNVWDDLNPGLKRIVIRVKTTANCDGILVVIARSTTRAETQSDSGNALPLLEW